MKKIIFLLLISFSSFSQTKVIEIDRECQFELFKKDVEIDKLQDKLNSMEEDFIIQRRRKRIWIIAYTGTTLFLLRTIGVLGAEISQ